jgi:hypothetical protein
VKRALLLALLLTACRQQDAAISVTITGPFRIPGDADQLSLDVLDAATKAVIVHKDWCVTTSATCATALPAQPGGLNQTVTLVESAGDHPHVKINLTLDQLGLPVGLGTNTADFEDGTTVPVSIVMSR